MFTFFQKLFRKPSPAAAPQPVPRAQPELASPVVKVETASLSLAAILSRFPADLKESIVKPPEGTVMVALPLSTILKQLPSGSVKMSLASIYRQAPSGTFSAPRMEEKRLVEVPLGEIFKRVKPELLKRRDDQRMNALAEDDGIDVFGDPTNPYLVAAPGAPADADPAPPVSAPLVFPAVIHAPEPRKTVATAPEEHAAAPQPMRIVAPPPGFGAPAPSPAAAAPPAQKTPIPAVGKPPAGNALILPLSVVSAEWPAEVKIELPSKLGATVSLPMADVAAGLAKGRVSFTWGQIRSWISPAMLHLSQLSESIELRLPLRVVAPAFLKSSTGSSSRKKVTVTDEIPALFEGLNRGRASEPGMKLAPEPVAEPVAESLPEPVAEPLPEAVPEPPSHPVEELPAAVSEPPLEPAVEPQKAEETPEPAAEIAAAEEENAVPVAVSAPPIATNEEEVAASATPSATNEEEIAASVAPIAVSAPPLEENAEEVPASAAPSEPDGGEIAASAPPSVTDGEEIAAPAAPSATDGVLVLETPVIPAATEIEAPALETSVAPALEPEPEAAPVPEPEATPEPESEPEVAATAETEPVAEVVQGESPAEPVISETVLVEAAPLEAAASVPVAAALGEIFGQPDKKDWSPAEIVTGIRNLPQFDGALVSLQEGLVVAEALPETMKGEDVAAFLPQIFSRLNQYSDEMKLGAVDDLLMRTNGAEFQVFRLGVVFFAVLGKPGHNLPRRELELIAEELKQTQK